MCLLEHIEKSLVGSKHSLALQLMYKPWACDRKLVAEHLPPKLVKLFIKLQESCRSALGVPVQKKPFLQAELIATAVKAYAQPAAGVILQLDVMAMHSEEQVVGQKREDLAGEGRSWETLPKSAQAALTALYVLADASLGFLAGIVTSKPSPLALGLTEAIAVLRACRL